MATVQASGWAPVILLVLAAASPVWAGIEGSGDRALVFRDVPARTREFIGYARSIPLTTEQRKLKERVLASIPASCCKDYSILTCCCPCNFAKSVWGLANYAIARLNYDEDRLKQAVLDWVRVVNPAGFTGDACYRNQCNQSFAANGCGGMRESNIVF